MKDAENAEIPGIIRLSENGRKRPFVDLLRTPCGLLDDAGP